MDTENKTVIFYITDNGSRLARKIAGLYPGAAVLRFRPEIVSGIWKDHRNFIFIMAAGIAVRTIAPLLKDKRIDPAVVVLDEKGRFAVSLVSGHLGGANNRAREIAHFLGGEAVVTTASDVRDMPSIDIWARDNDLVIDDWEAVPRIGTRLVNNGTLRVYTEVDMKLPDEFARTEDPRSAEVMITNKMNVISLIPHAKQQLYLRPKNLVIGLGCNSGTPAEEIEDAVRKSLLQNNLAFSSVHSLATIDIKVSEPGIASFAEKYAIPIISFSRVELNNVPGVATSEVAFRATGARAVAEPSALLASGAAQLLVSKEKRGNVTVAVAKRQSTVGVQHSNPFFAKGGQKGVKNAELETSATELRASGKIYIVGTGPGDIDHITPRARNAIGRSDVIIGYGTYLDLIPELVHDKEVYSTGMTQEIERCKKAVELALEGKTVSVISGGDPGIYAMAGLVFEICRVMACHAPTIAVEVIPGISALNACAARLGAPLMHDFATISLSDRLTPWELIEKRLEVAAMADFVIALYNPKSKGRVEHIRKARDIVLKHRNPETPVGIVKGAMRADEKVVVTDLGNMLDHDIDMQTTVIIGNSRTFVWQGWMITPRGYEKKLEK